MQHYKTTLEISNIDILKKTILDLYEESKENNTFLARGEIVSTYNVKKDLHLNPSFKELCELIEHHLTIFYGSPLKISEMWGNVTRKDGSLGRHTHSPNKAVGVFYLQADSNCGNIILGMNEEIPVSTNLLLLFNGEVEHRTMFNQGETDRIIVAVIAN